MVNHCVAYGCNNLQDPRKKIPFHTFPFKRPEILKLWIQAIRRDNWNPSRTSKICGEHFLPTDYQMKPGCTLKLLKPDAVPSIFYFPKHIAKKALSRRELVRHIPESENKDEPMDTNNGEPQQNLTSTSTQPKAFIDRETQTPMDNSIFQLRRKVKTLKQKIKRRELKICNMKDVIKEISNSGYSNENLDGVLKNYFGGLPLELVLLRKKDEEGKSSGQRRYSSLMKQFAHTLYFYSPKAYNFLRQYFVLPNGRTIRKWLCSLNCEPGILQEILDFLKEKVKENYHIKNCALIVDSMSIRKQVLWDQTQGKFTGNVNYGGIVDVDFEMVASEALFFEIVSYTTNFKCPVAYFLVNKTDANLQTQLITSCLKSLYENNITVRSITSDGAQTNISTYTKLGCNLESDEMVPFFIHPSSPETNVYCILDPCHMLKLARNACAEKKLSSSTGNISWEYVKKLDEIQQSEQLRLANSLSSQHVYYKNKIMNVRLATQAMSSGVADAIEYLDKSGVKEFQGSCATVEFMRNIDRTFDILNSRNPYGKGFKAPIRPSTLTYFEDSFSKIIEYFKSLKIDGVPLLNHNRKTFALGFILTMKSTVGLVKDLFALKENPPKYFLTYKYSQDHLELYFCCIRSRGGWNNNPNSQQLKWSLRQLLFRNSITPSVNANCGDFGNYCTPAFEFRSENRQNQEICDDVEELNEINTFLNYLEDHKLSYLQENILFYISGYIVKILSKQVNCDHCVYILFNKDANLNLDHSYSAPQEHFKKFTNFISHGGLIYSSDVVYKIVHFIERQFRCLIQNGSLLKNKINIKRLLTNTAINYFSKNITFFQPSHPVVQEFLAEDCHEIQLIRKIAEIFLKCRMHHHSKLMNVELHGKSATIRQKMTKLILFKNC